jgi:hypothetical protein
VRYVEGQAMTDPDHPDDPADAASEDDGPGPDDVIEIPIDGTLDLHHFHPRDLRTLIPDYLAACQQKGVLAVRLIHGKGTGAVQRSVHALLSRSPLVAGYRLAEAARGGWGATLVDLHPHADGDAGDDAGGAGG